MKKSKKVMCILILYFISIVVGVIIQNLYHIDILKTIAAGFFGFCWYGWFLSVKEQEKEEEKQKKV